MSTTRIIRNNFFGATGQASLWASNRFMASGKSRCDVPARAAMLLTHRNRYRIGVAIRIGIETNKIDTDSASEVDSFVSTMIVSQVNPQRRATPSRFETTFLIKTDSSRIGQDYLLMKPRIFFRHSPHDRPADSFPLEFGSYDQMRVVNNEVTVGQCVSQANQSIPIPGGNHGMRIGKCPQQRSRFFSGRPFQRGVKRDDLFLWKLLGFPILNS